MVEKLTKLKNEVVRLVLTDITETMGNDAEEYANDNVFVENVIYQHDKTNQMRKYTEVHIESHACWKVPKNKISKITEVLSTVETFGEMEEVLKSYTIKELYSQRWKLVKTEEEAE